MKKVLNNPLFMFILGALIFGSIGVIAGVINANDIHLNVNSKANGSNAICNTNITFYNKSEEE